MTHVRLVTLLASTLLAQQIVPVEQEPRHRTVYENRWVRALDVRFDAGAESQYHRHALHNVAVRIVGGVTRGDPIGGQGTAQHVPSGRAVFHSASPPYVHRVVNVGMNAVHIIDVELLAQQPVAVVGGADDVVGHVVEIENPHVRVSRVRIKAGESLPAHTHVRGWLDVVVSGGTPGAVAWHDAGRPAAVEGRAAGLEWIEVEPR